MTRATRGEIAMSIEAIDQDLCTGCGLCVLSCPTDVIRMEPVAGKAVIRYPEDCMICDFCAQDCPEQAITVSPYRPARPILSWG